MILKMKKSENTGELNKTLTDMRDKHRVSIGLPIFDGENYLEETLDSILAQTFTDFELIISDNASTDNTPLICQAYAAKDSRIRYYRNKRNLGASKNFNRVFELSSGEYFKWAAHDDILAPKFLSRCVSVLEQDSSIVLCYSKTGIIDEHGTLVGTYNDNMRAPPSRANSGKLHERFGELISFDYSVHPIFGVIRANSLKMTSLMGNYVGSDRNLLAEIGLIGRIYLIPEHLYFERRHPESYSNRIKKLHSTQERLAWWAPTKIGRITFTYNCIEYFRSVRRLPLKWTDRLLCYAKIVKWFFRRGWMLIILDIERGLLRRSGLGRKLDLAAKSLKRKMQERIGWKI